MSVLYEPARIKTMTVPNRRVRSAARDGMPDASGRVAASRIKLVSVLAADGAGLNISAIVCTITVARTGTTR